MYRELQLFYLYVLLIILRSLMMQIIFYGLISKRIFRTVMIIFGIRIRYSAVYMEKLVQNKLFVRAFY